MLGRDAARLIGWATTEAPAEVVGNYWHEWNGSAYVKAPDAEPVYNTSFNPDGSVNRTWIWRATDVPEPVRLVCAPHASVQNHR